MKRESAEIVLKTELPGPNAKSLEERFLKVTAPCTYAYGAVRDLTERESIGPWMKDVDGNWLLDFAGQVGVSVLGYNNPEVLEELDRIKRPTPGRHAGTDFIVGDAALRLMEKIVELTDKFGFDKVYLTTGGAKAVSAAKKACQDRRRGANIGISFKGAFHGRTLDALSSTTSKRVQREWYDAPGREIYLDYCVEDLFCNCGWMRNDKHTRERMSELEQFLNPRTGFINPEEVKYIIIEPVQGEGGYWVPSKAFMKEVERCAREYNIPLIVDEIQSGMGRTGKWWAVEHFDVKPDLITFGKGYQVNGVVAAAENHFSEEARESETCGNGGSDYMHVLESLLYIEQIKKHDLLANAEAMGEYLGRRLQGMVNNSVDLVKEQRGLGLMRAIEFRTKEQRDEFETRCFRKGLMTMGCGYKSLRLLPPLDVTTREIRAAYKVMWDVRTEMLHDIAKK